MSIKSKLTKDSENTLINMTMISYSLGIPVPVPTFFVMISWDDFLA
jgi:hypothetical protein